jgi:peptidyl-dipeptidase Dcp
MSTLPLDPAAERLLAPWPTPHPRLAHLGGLPPWRDVNPAALEEAHRIAIERKRADVRAIATNGELPSFANTIEALEDAGRELRRVRTLLNVWSQTMAVGDMPAVTQRLAPLASALEDEIAHDPALFARIEAVHGRRGALGEQQRRLVELVHERFLRRGAGLQPQARERLAQIHARLALLFAQFIRNLQVDEREVVWVEHEADLAGASELLRRQLRQAATELGRPEAWAVRNMRALVWPLLTQCANRALRERVWRMWTSRGDHAGEHDNKPVVAETLALRGEKARLLGYPSYAHFATAPRMARTPQAALTMLERTWAPVLARTKEQIAAFQAVADAEGADFELRPWDRLYYAQRYRQARFGFDTEALHPYLKLDAMLQAMCWSAGRLHDLTFEDITPLVPRIDDTVQVFEVRRGGAPLGVLYVDLFARPGKGHGSYQQEWRSAETFRGRVLPISCITSNLPRPAAGEPTLLAWEYANVFFHEFGHALHMLANATAYPSLGPMHVAWDFVELPSLLNERWLAERELLERFARHHVTREPVPPSLLDALQAALQFDRIFSVNLDYLGGALSEMKLHLLADGTPGRVFDVVKLEDELLASLGMPAAWDLVMRIPHSHHAMTEAYAAGLYVYLWADVMAADAAEAFEQAPGGWYDAEVARRWRENILSVGTSVPADEAYRRFRGRDPDPDALMRRFGLLAGAT